MAQRHEIKINIIDGKVVINGNLTTVSSNIARMLWNSIMEHLNEHCQDCKWFSVTDAIYNVDGMRVRVRRNEGKEIIFTIEE